MRNNNHLVVKKYLEGHSLVESNIISFNEFLEHRMQEIVSEISEGLANEEFEISLGKISIEKPKVIEADGSSSLIMPYEARLRNLTYSAPVTLEITIRKGDQVDSETVEIGKIPIMVKSKACNTCGMNNDQLVENFLTR
jgi:DNA-directed RNA polymerase subunit B"